MYRVVIVDDEPIIVEGLKRMVPWGKWSCEVVGTAEDGHEGIRVIAQVRPDIVITDIYMPEMDGLNMLAALRSEYPEMEVTILTGFRDFEYAQRAIGLGVTRFLLKPSKLDEIEEAIQTMAEKINAKYRKRSAEDSCEPIAAGGSGEWLAQSGRPDFGEALAAKQIELPPPLFMSAKEMAAIGPGDSGDDGTDEAASSFVVNNAIKYIEENYMMKLKLNDVADHVYVSQWHLSKLLNRYAGQSFSDVLNRIRIAKAKELLSDPSLRIGDVADMVGFLDMAHFSRVFKKQEGVSANEYRNGKR